MNSNKAPQNLIHDGFQGVEFIDDSNIRIELLGTYRPDFDDTYSLTEDMLIIRHNYIPYTFNNGLLLFDTWTTDVDGHIITWEMVSE